jgi:hypothetical protein
MENRQIRTLQSFQNVLAFIKQYPIRPEPPLLTGMRTQLEACVERIGDLHGTQYGAKHDASGHVDQRRRKLRRESMMPLVRIAKPLLAFAPGVEAGLRVPHARADAKTVALAALRMADVLKPHTRLLKQAGLSKTFLDDIRVEAQALADAAKTAEKGRQKRSVVTAAIGAEFRKGMQAVTVIEGLVMLHHAKRQDVMSVWRNRRRVTARLGRPRKSRAPQPLPS